MKSKAASAPYLVWMILFIVVPMLLVAYFAFTDSSGAFTLENIARVGQYSNVFLRSIWLGALSTVICLVLGYPVAYLISKSSFKRQSVLLMLMRFGEMPSRHRALKITIPESLDYTGVFDDIFRRYTSRCELVSVRTTNMGSLYRLQYHVLMRSGAHEKEFIDELRCRNGNLEIALGRMAAEHEEL